MNHTYRAVFNQRLDAWVAVSETAKTRGKGRRLRTASATIAAAMSLAFSSHTFALPADGSVSSGSGGIAQSGNTMTVTQTSQNLVLNWRSFGIDVPETVNFVQPNSSAIALNRVLGSDPSYIFGKLNANGQVFLLNPNGILFGKGAQVNVGGLVATTLGLSDADFMASRYRFSGTAGSVRNEGHVTTADGGYVALLGGQVSNQGTLVARLGNVTLAAGSDTTLDFVGDGLIRVTVNQGTFNAMAENKQLIRSDGGSVLLTAKAADALISAVVNNEGVIEARGVDTRDGVIRLVGDNSAGIAMNSGTLDGGQVAVDARSVLQTGTVRATYATLSASHALIQTASGSVTANALRVHGGEQAYLSGSLAGRDITVAGRRITLAGASVTTGKQGRIRIGGGAHGADADIANAEVVSLNGATTLTAGDDAQVVVWSDTTSNYFGKIVTGANGFVEVSSRGTLNLGGTVTTGANSQVLYDPADIVIDATAPASFYLDLADPNPAQGNHHGYGGVTPLSGGNIVVASPGDSFGGVGAGAAYLYNGGTGALISALFGSTGDYVGSRGLGVGDNSIVALTNGNYVVRSSYWNNGRGAVTWGSGTAGVSGVVSAANSLVGSTADDDVGWAGITALANGNYVVNSPLWNGRRGAVTWGSGTAGVSGAVSATNSLVGSTPGDYLGFNGYVNDVPDNGIFALANGNYVVRSSFWNGYRGAATWGSGTTGVSGEVSATNSLVGSTAGDAVGWAGITALTNGNYVVNSAGWNRGRGAATWGSGTTGVSGEISATNSLVGSTASDLVGSSGYVNGMPINGIVALSNGNYVVNSAWWNGDRGAATWGSGTTGVSGEISATNSLVGSTAGDSVGSAGITALTNGNYVVHSVWWSGARGAVTWGSGTSGISGTVSAANSLVGSTPGDYLGFNGYWLNDVPDYGIVALTNGNYVVRSPYWNGGRGAATWGSGTTGVSGEVSATNSLVGSTAGDSVGWAGITALTNGNYVVNSPFWNGQRGAATWGSGASGISGTVSAANSLVGAISGDFVGSSGVVNDAPDNGIVALANGNYVVRSAGWNGGRGAATWGSGTTGVSGEISATNSLVGSTAGDSVGFNGFGDGNGAPNNGIVALTNGNYVVSSTFWNGLGAVTWGNGTTGVCGAISADNSLIGSAESGGVGGGVIIALANGNYVWNKPGWNGYRGAATWGSGTTGVSGEVSATNSLVGSTAGDAIGNFGIIELSNGNYVVNSPLWNGNRGAATWASGTTGTSGTVSAANSVVGSAAGDQVSYRGFRNLGNDNWQPEHGIFALANGNYVVSSPYWNGGKGAIWLVADPANLGLLASNNLANATLSPAALAAVGAGSTVTLQASHDITVNSAVNMGGKLQLLAGNAVTLNAGLTSTDTGDALVLSGNSFINNAGANALSTPNGRWLVYSATPAGNALGGLSADGSVWNSSYAGNAPATIAAGKRFVYAVAAPSPLASGTGSEYQAALAAVQQPAQAPAAPPNSGNPLRNPDRASRRSDKDGARGGAIADFFPPAHFTLVGPGMRLPEGVGDDD